MTLAPVAPARLRAGAPAPAYAEQDTTVVQMPSAIALHMLDREPMPRNVLTAVRTSTAYNRTTYVTANQAVADWLSGWADALTREYTERGYDQAAVHYGFDIWALDVLRAEAAGAARELRGPAVLPSWTDIDPACTCTTMTGPPVSHRPSCDLRYSTAD